MAFWERERVTLVIEQEVVRLMGVEQGRVKRWGSAPLPRDTIHDGAVADELALAQVLEKLWANQLHQTPAPRDGLLVAIPGHHIPTRLISVRGLDTRNVALMTEKAREALPDPEAYHAWQVVGPASQPGLFVVAAPVALVDGYVAALRRAGLGVAAMDTKQLALVRAVGAPHAIILDGERSLGSILIVDEALPRRVRFPALDAPLLASPEEKIARLAEVLYHTIEEYNEDGVSQVLHPAVPVFLTGSLADHDLLREVVQTVLGHPIGRFAPTLVLPADMPLSQFMTNIGLAQKQGA